MSRSAIVLDRNTTAGTVAFARVGGIPIRFHFTFLLLLAFIVLVTLSHESGARFALYMVGLFASVVLHELAHAATAVRLGVGTQEIVLFPIGGLSRLARRLRPDEELWVALVGPITNFAISGILFGYMALTHQGVTINVAALLQPSADNVLQRLAFVNLLLAWFNLIPAFPMDGGRILRALLTFVRPEDEATRMAAWMGRMVAISMALYGLIFAEWTLVFFSFFIWLGATQETAAATGRTLTNGIPLRAAMVTHYQSLDHGATIRDAAHLLLATEQQDFPVMHGEHVVGLLGRDALLRALSNGGPGAYVAGVMDRDYVSLEPDADLSDVLPLMARAGKCALVMEDARLVGLLTSDNLSEFLMLRRYGLPVATA